MKYLLILLVGVALLLAGCGEDTKKPGGDSPESNQSSAETPTAKSPEVGGIDLGDPETLDKIIAEAIDANKLKLRGEEGENLAYAPNQQTPYTGWVKLIHDNGKIKVLGQFKDGKPDGLTTQWYEDGQKQTEGNLKDGKQDGLWTEWYENGQKSRKSSHKDGKIVSAVAWKPNGEKCPESNVKEGNGVLITYNKVGTEETRDTYKDGENVSPSILDRREVAEIRTEAIDSDRVEYWGRSSLGGTEDGVYYARNEEKPYTGWIKGTQLNVLGEEIRYLIQFKDGMKVLFWGWGKNDMQRVEVKYKNGKLDGQQTEWHLNGQKKSKDDMKADKRNGLRTEWDENGQKKWEETYKDDKLVTAVAWKPDGEKCPLTNVVDGSGVVVRYNEDGTERRRTTHKDGKQDGLATGWHKNGQKRLAMNYKDGKRDGLATGWYENGQKSSETNYKDDKLMSAEVWKPNGEKCPVTNVKDGNGVQVYYNDDGMESGRNTYKDGK